MADIVDHTEAPEPLMLAHSALERSMRLVWIKVRFPVHVQGVGEAKIYVRLRNELLEGLKQSGQHDLLDRATCLFPTRLVAIIDGDVKWDANADIRLLAELEARCEEAGLDTTYEEPSQDLDDLDAKLDGIEERSKWTREFQTNLSGLLKPFSPWRRSPDEVWSSDTPPPDADIAWPSRTDEAPAPVLAPPLPAAEGHLLPGPIASDNLRDASILPEYGTPSTLATEHVEPEPSLADIIASPQTNKSKKKPSPEMINAERRVQVVAAAKQYIKQQKHAPPSPFRLFTVVPKPSYRTWERWNSDKNPVRFDLTFEEVIAEALEGLTPKQP